MLLAVRWHAEFSEIAGDEEDSKCIVTTSPHLRFGNPLRAFEPGAMVANHIFVEGPRILG